MLLAASSTGCWVLAQLEVLTPHQLPGACSPYLSAVTFWLKRGCICIKYLKKQFATESSVGWVPGQAYLSSTCPAEGEHRGAAAPCASTGVPAAGRAMVVAPPLPAQRHRQQLNPLRLCPDLAASWGRCPFPCCRLRTTLQRVILQQAGLSEGNIIWRASRRA